MAVRSLRTVLYVPQESSSVKKLGKHTTTDHVDTVTGFTETVSGNQSGRTFASPLIDFDSPVCDGWQPHKQTPGR